MNSLTNNYALYHVTSICVSVCVYKSADTSREGVARMKQISQYQF